MLHKLSFAIAAAAALCADAPFAQTYPVKPIRFIIPFTPGGNTDVLGRLLGQKLTEAWGQPVVIDNRAGAGGTVGVDQASKAPPDGYTIVMGTFGSVLVANSLYKKLGYDPQRDLAPVVLVSTPPGLLVTHPQVPVKNVQELIAYARSSRQAELCVIGKRHVEPFVRGAFQRDGAGENRPCAL